MIDERHEELAALHALDLLEGEELAAFESALAADPDLRRLVSSLRDSAADLAFTAPAVPAPSAALRARILNSAVPHPGSNHGQILPFPTLPAWLGWASAACFFFAAVFFAAKSFNVRGELQSVLEAERVARLEAGTFKNLLEAERILSRGQLDRLASSTICALRPTSPASRSPHSNPSPAIRPRPAPSPSGIPTARRASWSSRNCPPSPQTRIISSGS
jgi:hypothetical protein